MYLAINYAPYSGRWYIYKYTGRIVLNGAEMYWAELSAHRLRRSSTARPPLLSYFSPAVELVALVCGLSSSCWCRSLPSGSSGRCLSHQEFNVHCGSNTAPVLIPAITQSSQLFKVWVHIVYGEYSFVIYPICRPLYSMILLRNIIYNIYIATSIASPYTSKDKGGLVNLPNN